MTDITITGSPAVAATATPTDAEILAALKAHLISQLEAGGVADYMIAGKRVTRYTLTELFPLIKYYENRVARTAIASGGFTLAKTRVRSIH